VPWPTEGRRSCLYSASTLCCGSLVGARSPLHWPQTRQVHPQFSKDCQARGSCSCGAHTSYRMSMSWLSVNSSTPQSSGSLPHVSSSASWASHVLGKCVEQRCVAHKHGQAAAVVPAGGPPSSQARVRRRAHLAAGPLGTERKESGALIAQAAAPLCQAPACCGLQTSTGHRQHSTPLPLRHSVSQLQRVAELLLLLSPEALLLCSLCPVPVTYHSPA